MLGALSPEDSEAVARQLAGSPELQAEADQLSQLLTQLPENLVPVVPSSAARSRLLAALDTFERFSPFVDTLSRLSTWPPIPSGSCWPGSTTPPPGSPGCRGCCTSTSPRGRAWSAWTRASSASSRAPVPRHRHLAGNEVTFVLEGLKIDDGGERIDGPGSVVTHEQDSVHGYAATGDRPLTIIVVNHGIQPVFS